MLKHLDEARMESESPLFRHAAYRAIDHLLINLEAKGGDNELNALKDFFPNVLDKQGVHTRVEWTIRQLEATLTKLKDFFPESIAEESRPMLIELMGEWARCKEGTVSRAAISR